jgi:predicted RNA binding protein YcfA (HicA-like mRNA interferase family)
MGIKDNKGRIERISVPVHGNKVLKKGLVSALIKLADIPID